MGDSTWLRRLGLVIIVAGTVCLLLALRAMDFGSTWNHIMGSRVASVSHNYLLIIVTVFAGLNWWRKGEVS